MSEDGPVWLGLDLGTGSVRALAVRDDGRICGRGSRPLHSVRDGERHEQDPSRWWPAAAAACREALAIAAPARVAAVAACATSGTVLLADRAGDPLTPALMYDDGRAAQQARRVNAAGPPLPAGAGWALPKLLWLLEHAAGTLPSGARVAHQSDVVARRLAGHAVATDHSHALKTGFDLAAGAWPEGLLDALGIAPALLPDVVAPGTVLGRVCAAAAAATAIPEATPIVAGMTDGCAGQIAAGAVREGAWNSVLGTTLVLKGASRELVRDPGGVLYCHRAPGGLWLPGGASSAGAGILRERFPGRDLDALGRQAERHGQTEVLAYPLLGRGERFPFAAPDAQAFVAGAPGGDGELFAALLLGLAYVERLCFEYVAALGAPTGGSLTLTGGATRNRHWCRLRADVLERPLRRAPGAESALGMAILAASATTGEPLAVVAERMAAPAELVEPRPDRAAHHRERYARFRGELERRGWLVPPAP